MKSRAILFFAAILGGVVSLRADPADDAIAAAMKLSTVTSYTWDTHLNQNSRALEIRGKTSSGGYSLVTFVGFSGGSVTTAGSGAGNEINTVFLGDARSVISSNGAWLTPSSTPAATEPDDTSAKNGSGRGATTARGGRSARGGAGGGTGAIGQRRRNTGSAGDNSSASAPADSSPRLPSAFNLPHEELAIVAANYSELHASEDGVSGKLTSSGAELLLLPPGSIQTPPEKAAGTFRLWLKDGAVTKYELKLTAASAPGSASHTAFAETVTVELSDIDATKVDVPPAAKKKLGV